MFALTLDNVNWLYSAEASLKLYNVSWTQKD